MATYEPMPELQSSELSGVHQRPASRVGRPTPTCSSRCWDGPWPMLPVAAPTAQSAASSVRVSGAARSWAASGASSRSQRCQPRSGRGVTGTAWATVAISVI